MIDIAKQEDELRRAFYETYLPRIDNTLSIDDVLTDYSDGIVRGNIIEFKESISDLNSVLFQTIKYLSARRIKGKPIPANILLVSQKDTHAYLYYSKDYLKDIEKVYMGGASKNNEGYVCSNYVARYDYSVSTEEEEMIQVLRTDNYTRIHLDENCIVGWAMSFYQQYPGASKSSFIGDQTGKMRVEGEIRKPDKLKPFIHPYKEKSNKQFRYLMDKLNDFIQKKDLGAFYTHPTYAKKALELVRKAIARVPEGNDYVIIDRCAGTGNLEIYMTDEELRHTIVSTLEYYEYKVLMEVLGDKTTIIPPTEHEDTFHMGLVRGADALSEEYVTNPIIQKKLNDPKCTVILFENPPYADTTSIEHQKRGKGKQTWKDSFVVKQMKYDIKQTKCIKGTATNDLGNAFIWSAFNYYLRYPTDSYIVFSPVKYWKAQHLVSKKFEEGFAFNRRHFHTNIDACIMCAWWTNKDVQEQESLTLHAYDLNNDTLVDCGLLSVDKIHYQYSQKYFDKRTFNNDLEEGIICSKDGTERFETKTIRVKPLTNSNILGYMAVYSSGFDNPDNMASLLIAARYDGNGFYLRRDNYLEKLPMFAASRYVTYERRWTERGRVMKSADGYESFERDVHTGKLQQYLLRCLLFTVLEPQNHMRTLMGSDGRKYVNPLCLDNTHGETLASRDLKGLVLTDEEQTLLTLWNNILQQARQTRNYNPTFTYGLYQIKSELNTTYPDPQTGETRYDYPDLQGNIKALAVRVKDYYLREIVPTLFQYQFLK
ncbi:MAG: hypothetical protein ILA34_01140 [Bacteroidaceae bacterium]|nr:hypothetical protein [Bacteroidaceae bacterium]